MNRFHQALLWVLLISGIYLYGFVAPTISYAAIVLLHVLFGVVLTPLIIGPLIQALKNAGKRLVAAWSALAVSAVAGLALIVLGATRPYTPILYAHIAFAGVGAILLVSNRGIRKTAVLASVAILLSAAVWTQREYVWNSSYRIENPAMPASDMDEEGDGPDGLFFPSSAQTSHGGKIPANFFMKSQACERCHADIYKQWTGSAHRFSSFNNQWYRKSIEFMQDHVGTRPSKWCAGCHDPAVIFSGMMDTPLREIVDRPESHAGLGCVTCHSIAHVKSTTGQGDFIIEYPELHDLATSENKVVRSLHDFLTYVNPEPHRRTFMKPFMKNQTAEFCSSCHKVHLDVPVNDYRWIRGFNDYDNWQASAVSGHGARSFYYPPKPQKCADCHMPLVPSNDAGNVNGMVHSHRFPAANTALAVANGDQEQLEATVKFLKDKIVSVDIFALSPASAVSAVDTPPRSELATTFAVGEEADSAVAGITRDVAPLTAPLNRVQTAVRPGDTVRIDVVVRTRKVGHFFPGGTVDAFDVWVEFIAKDEKDNVFFWSGKVEDEGKGPVERGAHFYRSLQIDGEGNPINKRNAWQTRSLVYARLIPPGAADTAHFRVRIPENVSGTIKLEAKLHYRKFAWDYTQFAFSDVRHKMPDVPIVTLAEDAVTLKIGDAKPEVVANAAEWDRWNDYGIGLLLQGDLKAAEASFQRVTEAAPDNPDGFVNIGRARLLEGNLEGAGAVLKQALALKPDLARTNFFYARFLRAQGQYDEALQHLRRVIEQYPRDRVVRNDTGRTLFLQRKYAEAIKEFETVLSIDPEDLQAHYNLMLCYNGLGDEAKAAEHQKRYLRFKADESSQALTGPYRLAHAEDNNERQPIHEHGSVNLQKKK